MLPPIARARAGGWPRERTVVIGDTPRDIACARADGVRVVAVATGPFGVEELADADAVADSAAAVVAVLEDWALGTPANVNGGWVGLGFEVVFRRSRPLSEPVTERSGALLQRFVGRPRARSRSNETRPPAAARTAFPTQRR